MAVLTLDFYSKELKMNTLLTVILPNSDHMGDTPLSKRRVLWLLHGLSEDATSWLRGSQIEQHIREEGLVAVLPSGGRSMYCDNVLGQNYFSYIADELPHYLHMVFGLSRTKEDNFIAGSSMGGMGAMKIALNYPERYAAVASLSGVLDLELMIPQITGETRAEFPFLIEAADDAKHSRFNPPALLDAEKDKDLKIYVACGLQDDLLPLNYSFKQRADALGIDIKYVFEDGTHNWDFWNRQIKLFIEYMLG